MLITVFTDASYFAECKVGAYAAWAKCDGRTERKSGLLKQRVNNSTAAELGALGYGLHMAVQRFAPTPNTRIILTSDCQTALDIIKNGRGHDNAYCREVAAFIRDLRIEHKLVLDLRHVKGHQGKKAGARHAVNEWCDAECYRIAKAERDRIMTPWKHRELEKQY